MRQLLLWVLGLTACYHTNRVSDGVVFMSPQTVLDFWFQEASPRQWFVKDETFDRMIYERFFETYRQGAAGHFDEWTKTPEGALALVIVLDQFSRNLFRNSAQAFATDAKALGIAKAAIRVGADQHLHSPVQRKFLYMPFMHAENLQDQDAGLVLFEQLKDTQTLDYARHHRAIIARFGRFPHRNSDLKRPSSPEEIAFLKQADALRK